ncbi:Heat shock protein STI [Atta colombica]|uniref:Heat shock protein STI n=1 Tax=Atta colombica TaxID=520822 RepID=A0A195BWL6_9HYME|nr:Heat shock protein STI [Atta colombica]
MAGAHLLHDDYVHSRKDSDDEAFNLKIINRLVNTLSRELSLESYWKIRNTVNESMSTQEAEKKYQKAMIHYSQAIKLDPKNYSLYSNRSFTFLMLERYRDALNDALITIRLKPDWSKGYFRKGEVELKLFSYNEALESYNKALSLQPNEPKILEAMNKASKSLIKDRRADQQIPWLGAGVGIILGVTVVIADYVFTNKPTLTHPLLMALLTMTIAMIGFGIAKGLRYFLKHQRKSVLIEGDFPHCLLEANELNDIYVKESTDIKKKERRLEDISGREKKSLIEGSKGLGCRRMRRRVARHTAHVVVASRPGVPLPHRKWNLETGWRKNPKETEESLTGKKQRRRTFREDARNERSIAGTLSTIAWCSASYLSRTRMRERMRDASSRHTRLYGQQNGMFCHLRI